MKTGLMIIAIASIVSMGVTYSFAEEPCWKDVRTQVEQSCQQSDAATAVHVAMKAWRDARSIYGKEHTCTAECIAIVADVAKYREKYHLAERLYKKALALQEKNL